MYSPVYGPDAMRLKQLTAISLALMLLTAGIGTVAAAPSNGNAPDDAGAPDNGGADNEHAGGQDAGGNQSEAGGPPADVENKSDDVRRGPPENKTRGPPVDMPEQVPDHVVKIHKVIFAHQFGNETNSSGSIGQEIQAIAGLLSDNGDDEADGNETQTDDEEVDGDEQEETATETPTGEEETEDGEQTEEETTTATPTPTADGSA